MTRLRTLNNRRRRKLTGPYWRRIGHIGRIERTDRGVFMTILGMDSAGFHEAITTGPIKPVELWSNDAVHYASIDVATGAVTVRDRAVYEREEDFVPADRVP